MMEMYYVIQTTGRNAPYRTAGQCHTIQIENLKRPEIWKQNIESD